MQSIDESGRRCAEPGCFHTAWGSRLCSTCLDDRPPLKRGPPDLRDWLYAHACGGVDLQVTLARQARVNPNSEPPNDEDEAFSQPCEVCSNECAEHDTLCERCRDNVHSM